jgi:hypothetical protein
MFQDMIRSARVSRALAHAEKRNVIASRLTQEAELRLDGHGQIYFIGIEHNPNTAGTPFSRSQVRFVDGIGVEYTMDTRSFELAAELVD